MSGLLSDPAWVAAFAGGLLLTGLVAGVLAGLLGVGGGIVIVPVLFHVFTALELDPAVKMHLAVGTSLATIVPTSIISARSHHRRGGVDPGLLEAWAVWVALGVVAGTALAAWVRGPVLSGVFAAVAMLVAANMAFRGEASALAAALPGRAAQRGIAFVIGGFSAMMGIGGGTLSVPILSAFSYPIRRAVGTAAAIGLIIAVPGALGFVVSGWGQPGLPPGSLGYVNLIGFALIVPTTMLSAPLGARLAHGMATLWLRRAFALFLFLTSVRMIAALA